MDYDIVKDLRSQAKSHALDVNLDILDEAADEIISLRQLLVTSSTEKVNALARLEQLAQQTSLQAQINTLNDAITEDKILVAYTKQLESSNNELVEALREISQVNHSSAKCGDIAKQALEAYEAKPINESVK